jgi:hypothetical protein
MAQLLRRLAIECIFGLLQPKEQLFSLYVRQGALVAQCSALLTSDLEGPGSNPG